MRSKSGGEPSPLRRSSFRADMENCISGTILVSYWTPGLSETKVPISKLWLIK